VYEYLTSADHAKADVYDYKSGKFSIQIIKYHVYVTVIDSSAQFYSVFNLIG